MHEVSKQLMGIFEDTGAHIRGIEIGCLSGTFDFWLLSSYPNMKMTSIDPKPWYDNIYHYLNSHPDINERFRLIVATSDDAVRFLERVYDFVFIDGDHSYEQTRRDILNYWQVIKPGGLICGHNYENRKEASHPGVAQAVNEIFGAENIALGADVTWWKYV